MNRVPTKNNEKQAYFPKKRIYLKMTMGQRQVALWKRQ